MRRILVFVVAAAALAGCGKPKQDDHPAAPSAVALPASTGLGLQGRLTATGAEPFWRLDIAPTGLTFSRAGAAAIPAPYVAPVPDEGGAGLVSGPISVRLTVQPCSDGVSTAAYPMRAHVEVKGAGMFDGCAYARWDNALEAMLPAIDACLEQTTEPSPVIYAARTASGALVRLSGIEDGERYDCVVDARGEASPILVSDAEPAPGERDPTFTRAPADPPAKACGAVEMKGRNGALLGWETGAAAC